MDKKEIKRTYTQTPRLMGIYLVKNLESGKIYIGRSADLNGKLNSERFQLKNSMHMNRELQNDFNVLGGEKFSFEILDRLMPKEKPDYDYGEELKTLEAMWLEKLQPFDARGYHKKSHKMAAGNQS
jgi:hypothetical protein